MRIMTNSYIKGSEYQNKFKNRMEKDIINDEEYQKFKEEERATLNQATNQPIFNHRLQQSMINHVTGKTTLISLA